MLLLFLLKKPRPVVQWSTMIYQDRGVIRNDIQTDKMCVGISKDGKFTKDFGRIKEIERFCQ
jgi:hypothetical protein